MGSHSCFQVDSRPQTLAKFFKLLISWLEELTTGPVERRSAPSAGCSPSKSVLQFAAWRTERGTQEKDEQKGVACVSGKILAKARGRREYRGRQ